MSEADQNSTNPNRRQWFLAWRQPDPSLAIDSTSTPDKSDTEDNRLPLAEEDLPLQYFTHRAMACQFQFWFPWGRYPQAAQAAMDACLLIDQLEQQLSVYRPDSELSLVNQFARESWIETSPRLFELLQLGQQLAGETQGAFDLTSTPLSRAWGFFDRQPRLIPADRVQEALGKVGHSLLELDLDRRAIRYLAPSVEVNLNSIGKGYALDQVTVMFAERGIHDYLIHGGQSSVVARGQLLPQAQPATGCTGWSVGISDPVTPNHRLGEIQLVDTALATSGSMRQGFFVNGRRLSHIIDPRSGWPVDHWLAVTVLHPQAAQADALATALSVMSPNEVNGFCQQRRDVQAILVRQGDSQRRLSIETHNLDDRQCRWVTD